MPTSLFTHSLILELSESTSVTVAFYSAFLNIHQNGVLTTLFGCYMAGATWNCCRLGARSVYTMQPCTSLQCLFIGSRHVWLAVKHQVTYLLIRSHILRMHGRLAVACRLPVCQNDRDLLRATAVIRGGMDSEIRVSAENWPWRRKFSCRSCRDSNPRPLDHESCRDSNPLPLDTDLSLLLRSAFDTIKFINWVRIFNFCPCHRYQQLFIG